MKLSNQQIAAIVNEIYSASEDKRKKEIIDRQRQLKSHVEEEAKRYADLIKQIPANVRKIAYLEKWTDFKAFVRTIFDEVVPTTKQINKSDITRKIILASIDANTLDELKKKLKITF